MEVKGFVFLCAILAVTFMQVASELDVFTTNASPLQGATIMLTCRITKPNGYPVEWKRSNTEHGTKTIASTHMLRDCSNKGWFVSDRTYYIWSTCDISKKDAASQDFNLTIIKTRAVDSGHWTCDEMNAPVRKSVVITVLIPPAKPVVTGLGRISIGTPSHTLTCDANQKGLKDPITYQWYKDGTLVGTGNKLTLSSVKLSDSGTYKCKATNTHGTTETSGTVEATDKLLSLKLTASPTTVIEGQKVKLTCTATGGDPTLHLTSNGAQWVKKSMKTKTYVVDAVVKRDDTEIVCTGEEGAVKLTSKVTLDIKYAPTLAITTSPANGVVVEKTSNVHLACKANGGNPSNPADGTIAWHRNEKEIAKVTGSELSYALTKPSRDLGGVYKCIVSNYKGLVTGKSTLIQIIYRAEWDPAYPDRRTAMADLTKMAQFTLHIITNSKPTKVAWVKEGTTYLPNSPPPTLGTNFLAEAINDRTYRLNNWRVGATDYGRYYVYVTNDAGTSPFLFTLFAPGAPFPPCCLNVTSVNSAAVTLTFKGNYTRPSAQKFMIYYKTGSMVWTQYGKSISDSGSTAPISQKIIELSRGTKYEFKVRAVNSYGKSDYSETVTGTTTEVADLPSSSEINLTLGGDPVVIVSWPKLPKGITARVRACPRHGNETPCKTYFGVNVTSIGIPVKGDPYKQYTFSIQLYDGDDRIGYTTGELYVKKTPPPHDIANYAYGIIGFVCGCVLVAIIGAIIAKSRRFCKKQRPDRPFPDDEFETYSNAYDIPARDNAGQSQLPTVAGGTTIGLSFDAVRFNNHTYSNGTDNMQNGNAMRDSGGPDEIYVNLAEARGQENHPAPTGQSAHPAPTNEYERPGAVHQDAPPNYSSLNGNVGHMQSPGDEVYVGYNPRATHNP